MRLMIAMTVVAVGVIIVRGMIAMPMTTSRLALAKEGHEHKTP